MRVLLIAIAGLAISCGSDNNNSAIDAAVNPADAHVGMIDAGPGMTDAKPAPPDAGGGADAMPTADFAQFVKDLILNKTADNLAPVAVDFNLTDPMSADEFDSLFH